jgi:hypothetical protein
MVQLQYAALTATLGLASASGVVAVRQMNGMDMALATRLGSLLRQSGEAGTSIVLVEAMHQSRDPHPWVISTRSG